MFLTIVHEIENLFGKDFQGVCEGQVAGEFCCGRGVDVEDISTVSLIQLEKEFLEQSILTLDTQKGPGPDGIYIR
jgi:hypothetical protein